MDRILSAVGLVGAFVGLVFWLERSSRRDDSRRPELPTLPKVRPVIVAAGARCWRTVGGTPTLVAVVVSVVVGAAFVVWEQISTTHADIEPPADSATIMPWDEMWTVTNRGWLFTMQQAELDCFALVSKPDKSILSNSNSWGDLHISDVKNGVLVDIPPGEPASVPCNFDDTWPMTFWKYRPPGVSWPPFTMEFHVTVRYRVGWFWPFSISREVKKTRLWETTPDGSHHWVPER